MRVKKRGMSVPGGQGAYLMALITLFLMGAVAGSYFAANISGAGQRYIQGFLSGPAETGLGGMWQVIACEAALMLAVILSAFFSFGRLLAPLALGAKGFMLSMLVSAFVKTLGARGYLAALALVALSGFISVTCLVLVGLQAMELAGQRQHSRGRIYVDRAFFLTAGICMALTVLATVLYYYITPVVGQAVVSIG